MENRLWVTPNNDLEAKTIVEMLQREGEKYIVTQQGWGASWEMLEPEIFEQLRNKGLKIEETDIQELGNIDNDISEINRQIGEAYSEYNSTEDENEKENIMTEIDNLKRLKEEKVNYRKDFASGVLRKIDFEHCGIQVYGVELQGDSTGAINVDHHTYGEDDRSNPKSSIEQVAEILGVELTLDEQFVSANDKGYIPAMEKLGVDLGLSAEDLQEIIANIRMRDREMQGITPEQEAQAQEAVEKLGEITEKRKYIQLDLPHSKTPTVTDRLYGKYDNLLITSGDGETNFYGATEIIKMLNERFPGGWSGGQLDQGSGFWGGYADQESIKKAVEEMIARENSNTKESKLHDED